MSYPTWKGRVMDRVGDDYLAIVGPLDDPPPLGSARLVGRRAWRPYEEEIPVEVVDQDGDRVLVRLPTVLALLMFDATGIRPA